MTIVVYNKNYKSVKKLYFFISLLYWWYDGGMEIVKLYFIDLEQGFRHKDKLLKCVNDRQKEKALRYKNEVDQVRSLVSSCLVNSLSKEPLLFGNMGKPYYENGPFFNISHSGNFVMMGVSDKEVGVDIEENVVKDMSLLLRIFNEAEAKVIKEHSDFYYLWCAKESLIKCTGGSVNKVKDVPSLPLNGIKTYKGKDYQCQTFIYEKHIVSITREGSEQFKVDIQRLKGFPFAIK